jgi:hypothetical protein
MFELKFGREIASNIIDGIEFRLGGFLLLESGCRQVLGIYLYVRLSVLARLTENFGCN